MKVANANRDLRVLANGSRAECEDLVRRRGSVDRAEDRIGRVYRLRRRETLPAREHFLVAGPSGATPKALRNFGAWWNEIAQEQLSLTPTS